MGAFKYLHLAVICLWFFYLLRISLIPNNPQPREEERRGAIKESIPKKRLSGPGGPTFVLPIAGGLLLAGGLGVSLLRRG